eukprot:9364173-Pyramimonas_sp.AAC.1
MNLAAEETGRGATRRSLRKARDRGERKIYILARGLQNPESPRHGVDCRLAMWQSADKEYTSNIRSNIRNAVR